jgi:signal transduction histidine kinase/CheY-like chemotaxis protein
LKDTNKKYFITEKAVALLVLVVIVLAGLTYFFVETLKTVSEANENAVKAINESLHSVEINNNLSDISEVVNNALILREKKLYVQLDPTRCRIGLWILSHSSDTSISRVEKDAFKSIIPLHKELHVSLSKLVRLIDDSKYGEAKRVFLRKYVPQIKKLKNEINGINTIHDLHSQKLVAKSKRWIKKVLVLWSVIGAIVVCLVILISISILYSNKKATGEKNEMHRQVLQASKLASIGELASGVAHEINNPLAIIRGHVELLESNYGDVTDEQREMMKVIDEAVDRIKKIVNGLRTYARSDSEGVGVFDVHSVILESFSLVGNIIEQKNIEIIADLEARNSKVVGNQGKFQQVIINLLVNAKDAMKTFGGKLTIATLNYKGSVVVRVEDNGCGIPADNVDKVFDTFFTTKAAGEGTGLGLGIVQSIVTEMHGLISVKSKVGEGTVFAIKLPVTDMKADVKTDKPRVTEADVLQGTVLVVDDEPAIRNMLTALLQTLGLTVEAVDSGESALLALARKRFDIVITDIQMPEMSGDVLIKRAREDMELTDVKYIIITGGLDVKNLGEKEKHLMDIADGFLPKPFTRKEIFQVLSNLR